MKDIRNILLLIVSVCLVGTWVYHLYDKSKYSEQPLPAQLQTTAAEASRKNDSLRAAYNLLLTELDSSRNRVGDTTVITTGMLTENEQLDSLRNEISYILAINDITKEDLRRAEAKIKDLQKRIESSTAVKTSAVKDIPTSSGLQAVVTAPAVSTKKAPETIPALIATGVSFRALEGNGLANTQAGVVNQFAITCSLQSNTASFAETDIFVVVADPSGNVIQDDPWQSGMFLTDSGVRIPYTRKSTLSHNKGETNRLAVNLKLPVYEKGTYGLQLYHNGVRIGRANLRLN